MHKLINDQNRIDTLRTHYEDQEAYWEHFGRYDEEPNEWQIDETSAEYQDRERNQ